MIINISSIKSDLEPLFQMMEEKEKIIPADEWMNYLQAIQHRIIQSPDQYLQDHRIASAELSNAIEGIFKDRWEFSLPSTLAN